MTIVFQILAVVVVVIVAFLNLRRGGDRHQAIRRILMLVFIVAAALAVFFPQLLTWAANIVGIGRGTDLLLYFLVLTFLGFVATSYRRFRHLESTVTELSRQVALMRVEQPESPEQAAD